MSCLCCHRQSWTYPKVFLKRPSFVGKNTAADWLLPIKTISVLSLEMSRLPFLKYQLFLSTQTRLEIARRSIKINRVWVFGGFFDFFFFFLPQTSWKWADLSSENINFCHLRKLSRDFLKNIQWCYTFECLAASWLPTPPPSPPPPDMKVWLLPCNVTVI